MTHCSDPITTMGLTQDESLGLQRSLLAALWNVVSTEILAEQSSESQDIEANCHCADSVILMLIAT